MISRIILGLGFMIWTLTLFGRQPCTGYESKMQVYFDSELNVDEAKKIFEEYSSYKCADMLLAYNFIGFAYYNISDYQKASEYFIQGEDVYSANKRNVEQYVINQMYTGLILMAERDFDSALYHLEKAKKNLSKVRVKFVWATTFQNIGLLLIEKGELDEAEVYFDRAVETQALDSISIGYMYQNLAFLNLKRGDKTKTRQYIAKAKKLWSSLDFEKGKYLLSFIETKLAIKDKDFESALAFLKEGRSEVEAETKLLLGENYLIEAQIYEGMRDTTAQLVALENAILESEDLSEEQLDQAILTYSQIQDGSKSNALLSGLVSKLRKQNLNHKKIDVKRNRIMDFESEEDQSVIRTQLMYLGLLAAMLLMVMILCFRVRSQKADIQDLNTDLSNSKLEIENQVEKLQLKNKELEQFAYVASHDLKSPLRTISSFAGLLKKKNAIQDENNYLDIIVDSAKNMTVMISDLLNYSKLNQELNIVDVNLKNLINETISRIDTHVKESNCEITINDNCNITIPCDRTLFGNVIQNLVTNSIQYSKDDEVAQIDIAAKKEGNKVVITIADNGIGIDDPYQEKVFEMFTRLKSNDVDGTGIGLSNCQKIVENHKGTISLSSVLDEGSIFTITLPC